MFQLTDVIQDVSDLKFGRRQMPMGTGDKELLVSINNSLDVSIKVREFLLNLRRE